ncbi:MAG: capsule assembly Wzi family protein [Gemmatimonadaceae bacterium]
MHSQNAPFFIFPYSGSDRSSFASPWHLGRSSADLPLRPGTGAITRIDPGMFAITLATRSVEIGATTANSWWGPAIRSSLVLSNNAPGIPRVFVRTARPAPNRLGPVHAELIAGTLTESRFFDRSASNDYRSVSGVRVALRAAFDTGLTLGASRQTRDQLTSLFGRWAIRRRGGLLRMGAHGTAAVVARMARVALSHAGIHARPPVGDPRIRRSADHPGVGGGERSRATADLPGVSSSNSGTRFL